MKDSKNSTNLGCGRCLSDSTLKKKMAAFGEVYHTQGSNPYRHVEVLVGQIDQWAIWLEKMEGKKMLPLEVKERFLHYIRSGQ